MEFLLAQFVDLVYRGLTGCVRTPAASSERSIAPSELCCESLHIPNLLRALQRLLAVRQVTQSYFFNIMPRDCSWSVV
jgi:hypothetical protein